MSTVNDPQYHLNRYLQGKMSEEEVIEALTCDPVQASDNLSLLIEKIGQLDLVHSSTTKSLEKLSRETLKSLPTSILQRLVPEARATITGFLDLASRLRLAKSAKDLSDVYLRMHHIDPRIASNIFTKWLQIPDEPGLTEFITKCVDATAENTPLELTISGPGSHPERFSLLQKFTNLSVNVMATPDTTEPLTKAVIEKFLHLKELKLYSACGKHLPATFFTENRFPKTLTRAELYYAGIDDVGLEQLFTCSPRLQELVLDRCRNSTANVTFPKSLEALGLAVTNTNDGGLAKVCECKRLRELGLLECRAISTEGFVKVTFPESLQFLNVTKTHISDAGLKIEQCTQMKTLALIDCVGLVELAPLPPLLTLLALSGTNINDAGLRKVRNCPHLESLYLDGCQALSNDALAAFEYPKSLKDFRARDTSIDHRAVRKLLALPHLFHLDVIVAPNLSLVDLFGETFSSPVATLFLPQTPSEEMLMLLIQRCPKLRDLFFPRNDQILPTDAVHRAQKAKPGLAIQRTS